MKRIEFYYPSFTKKALTFTIDDGNMKYDRMLLDILEPAGIRGTFNLCSNIHKGRENETREFYKGYGIANHCKHHPLVNFNGVEYVESSEPFNPESSDPTKIYKVDGNDGFFWVMRPNGWRQMIYEDDFIRFVREGLDELNAMFGGGVRDFVWPYGEQNNAAVKEYVNSVHRSVRKTGPTIDLNGFAIPEKMGWSYNANHLNLLEVMERYEKYHDDGELKFFAFGVHSIDFERDDKWDDLKKFAEKYGNRPDTYWYASVEEIFDYEEATALLKVEDLAAVNTGNITLYVGIDGVKQVIEPGQSVSI